MSVSEQAICTIQEVAEHEQFIQAVLTHIHISVWIHHPVLQVHCAWRFLHCYKRTGIIKIIIMIAFTHSPAAVCCLYLPGNFFSNTPLSGSCGLVIFNTWRNWGKISKPFQQQSYGLNCWSVFESLHSSISLCLILWYAVMPEVVSTLCELVCVYVCVCVCMREREGGRERETHTHTMCTHWHAHTHTHNAHTGMHAHTHTHVHTHTHTHARMHTYKHTSNREMCASLTQLVKQNMQRQRLNHTYVHTHTHTHTHINTHTHSKRQAEKLAEVHNESKY